MAIKKVEYEKVVCDICGKEADGEYYSTSYLNNRVYAESYCPHDLCKDHMEIWATHCLNQEFGRYEGSPNEEERLKMLEVLKKKVEEEEKRRQFEW